MKQRELAAAVACIALAAALLGGTAWLLGGVAGANAQAEEFAALRVLLPGAADFVPEPASQEDSSVRRVWRAEGGYVVETAADGYASELVLWVGVRDDGTVTGVQIRQMAETRGLGADARRAEFLDQFAGKSGELSIGREIDAVSGATVTSKAVVRSVNAAIGFVTGADIGSSATQWG